MNVSLIEDSPRLSVNSVSTFLIPFRFFLSFSYSMKQLIKCVWLKKLEPTHPFLIVKVHNYSLMTLYIYMCLLGQNMVYFVIIKL